MQYVLIYVNFQIKKKHFTWALADQTIKLGGSSRVPDVFVSAILLPCPHFR